MTEFTAYFDGRWMTPLAKAILKWHFGRYNRRRKVCKHGHRLEGENLRVYKQGQYPHRTCMKCARRNQTRKRMLAKKRLNFAEGRYELRRVGGILGGELRQHGSDVEPSGLGDV